MTKEEKKELIDKIGTQIDGAECYLRKLYDDDAKDGSVDRTLEVLMIDITYILRVHLQQYEDKVDLGEA